MKMHWLVIVCMGILISACEKVKPATYEEEAYVFGTLVKFTVFGVPEDTAREAVKNIGQEFQRMHNQWNAWKPGEVTEINLAVSRGETVKISGFVLPVIAKGKEYYSKSEGLFNPAIGALIEAWGFHSDELPVGSLPSFDRINRLVDANPNMDDIILEGNFLRCNNKLVQFDFGGFGKGLALDRAEEIFDQYGIKNAVINAGGDINTLGNPGGRPWKVGIRHPVHWGAIASVELVNGENLYTSGNYERFHESEGIKYSHIIDPRNGMPVNHILSTSVIHTNGALADAAATALTIAGPDNWYRIAKRMGIQYVMLIDEQGVVYLNPAMMERVTFTDIENVKIMVSEPLINENLKGV